MLSLFLAIDYPFQGTGHDFLSIQSNDSDCQGLNFLHNIFHQYVQTYYIGHQDICMPIHIRFLWQPQIRLFCGQILSIDLRQDSIFGTMNVYFQSHDQEREIQRQISI